MLRAPGALQTRPALLAQVWGPLAEVEDANLDCYIHFVRRRLAAVGSRCRIATVRGSGYKLRGRAMMRALRRRLALVMTALTALGAGRGAAVTWQFSQQQYTASAEALFAQNFTALWRPPG